MSIKEDKDKIPFIKQLKNQFSAIHETLKKEEKKENLPFINLTNRTYKTVLPGIFRVEKIQG